MGWRGGEPWLNEAARLGARSRGATATTRLTPQQVQRFINQLAKSGLSSASVHRIRAVLRRALNQALNWDLVHRNVATLVDLPKAERPRFEPMTHQQARQLLTAARGHRYEALINLALATGLRQGELLALHWTDIDLETSHLQVRHTFQRLEGKLALTADVYTHVMPNLKRDAANKLGNALWGSDEDHPEDSDPTTE